MLRRRWINHWRANLSPRHKPNHTVARSNTNRRRAVVGVTCKKVSKRRSKTTAASAYNPVASSSLAATCRELHAKDERHHRMRSKNHFARLNTERLSPVLVRTATA